jgi:hypothetical protein
MSGCSGHTLFANLGSNVMGGGTTMSYVLAVPELVSYAATGLVDLGSSLDAASRAAVSGTTELLAAADDEVSTAIASLFSSHGQAFQAMNAEASAFHARFVQALSAAGLSYATTEAANAAPLQTLEQSLQGLGVFSPVK